MFNLLGKNSSVTPRKDNKEAEKERLVNPQELLEAEKEYLKGVRKLRDLIAPSSFVVSSNYVQVGSIYARTLFVTTFPKYISPGWVEDIIDYPAEFDFAECFYPLDAGVILKQLKKKVGELEAQLMADAEKGAPRDPMREEALRNIEKLRDDITQGIEHFFQYGVYMTIYAKSKEELDILTDRIEGVFASKIVMTRRALFQTEQGYNSTLPVFTDELNIYQNLNTSPLAAGFPFVSAELTSDDGVLYGINRHNNSLIIFDRFSLQNANMVVLGPPGGGKSYAVKLEVLRQLMLGADLIIIDPEREYKTLSDAVGGTFINITVNSEAKINPFDLPRVRPEEIRTADVLRTAITTLKGLLKIMLGDLTVEETSILDRALIETYALKDITPATDLSQDLEYPTLSDLQQILESMEGTESMVERLKKYTEGTFSGFLNNPTNVDMNNQLIVFSVRDLEQELVPIAMYTIVNYIWNIVRSQLKKRILVIDEAWWMLENEYSASFLFALAKRGRKYYLGLTTISQNINDFLGSKYGQALVENSALRLLMPQTEASIDAVAETFKLTQSERYLLISSGVGEGIFFAGNKRAAIKIVASYTEDQLITTNPQELLEIEEAKKKFDEGKNLEMEIE